MKKKLIALLVLALASAALYIFIHNKSMSNEGLLEREGIIILYGNVEVTEINAGFKAAGGIAGLNVEEGQPVKAGQTLATLDSIELQSAVTQSTAALNESIARLAELKAGSRAEEIAQAHSAALNAKAEYDRALKDFTRADILYREGAVSAQAFDNAKTAKDATGAQYNKAMQYLDMVRAGPRKEAITAAEEKVKQSQAALDIARQRLKDATLIAPSDGVILKKTAEAGEVVAAGAPVCIIGVLNSPWVKVYIREQDLGIVKLGQRAEVTIDTSTKTSKKYQGSVSYISSEAEFTPKTIQTLDERTKLVFGVKVRTVNENGELKPGMPANVKIFVK
ncbi:MAG: efflux RND transporter periplasmic adaptor subunit [Nitrospirae bacterium]|nr:efflux RND transporter periplasmic adaptor subunit [Nitrospirota bacterium]